MCAQWRLCITWNSCIACIPCSHTLPYAWQYLYKEGTENKAKWKKGKLKNNIVKQTSKLIWEKGSCFNVGVKGSDLQFNKRRVASCDWHCNFGKIFGLQYNTYCYHIFLSLQLYIVSISYPCSSLSYTFLSTFILAILNRYGKILYS